jgi:hypothetical protein
MHVLRVATAAAAACCSLRPLVPADSEECGAATHRRPLLHVLTAWPAAGPGVLAAGIINILRHSALPPPRIGEAVGAPRPRGSARSWSSTECAACALLLSTRHSC